MMIVGQDANPMVWGAMDRFHAHFIVRREGQDSPELAARTRVRTRGMFGSKKVERVGWIGAGALAQALDSDAELCGMIAKMPPRDAEIYVEPTDSGVRIHGRWRAAHELDIPREEFEIYDRIAGHIRSA